MGLLREKFGWVVRRRVSFRGHVISPSCDFSSATRISLEPAALSSCVNRRGTGRGLQVCVGTTLKHGRTLSRMLLCNPPNLNGAALSNVVTERVNMGLHIASNPTVRGRNSLITVLASLGTNSILFVSRVRHLPHGIRRVLCPTVRSFSLSVVLNGNPSTESVELSIPGFALINTAAHSKRLATPLHSHFNILLELRLCAPRRLTGVIAHSTNVLNVTVSDSNTLRVTSHSHKAPHVTGHLLGHMHSVTRIRCSKRVARGITHTTLTEFRVSRLNLSSFSHGVLSAVVAGCGNNPINLSALTTTVNRRTMAVRSICRPCLVRVNFLAEATENEYMAGLTCSRLKVTVGSGNTRRSVFWDRVL